MPSRIAVVNYDAGNLYSVLRGLKACDVEPDVVSQPAELHGCSGIILPGVGAFPNGMERLNATGLADAIREKVERGIPLLGICLGAQLLLDWSDEFGRTVGLGLVAGNVVRMHPGEGIKVPHVGWAPLYGDQGWEGTLLADCQGSEFFYFNHSFVCVPTNPKLSLASTDYGETRFTAVFSQGCVSGIQFHPELSSWPGIGILQRFVRT